MMSIPRTVSSKISICKRMKVGGERPFTFPPHCMALIQHLLRSLFMTSTPNSLRKETRTCTSPLSMQCGVELDRHRAERGCCRQLLCSHSAGPLLAALPAPNSWAFFTRQNKVLPTFFILNSRKCPLFSGTRVYQV